jgi:hypothetical protein
VRTTNGGADERLRERAIGAPAEALAVMSSGAELDAAWDRLGAPKPPPVRPRRRRLRRLSWMTGLSLAVFLVVATGYSAHYQPLRRMGWSSAQGGGIETVSDGVADYTGFLIDPTAGHPAQFSIDVENEGRFAVTVTGMGRGDQISSDGFAAHWVEPDPSNDTDQIRASELRSFPVTIQPRQQVTMMLSFPKRVSCAAGETADLNSISVSSRALGWSHNVRLPFPVPMYVCFPATGVHLAGGWTVHVGD